MNKRRARAAPDHLQLLPNGEHIVLSDREPDWVVAAPADGRVHGQAPWAALAGTAGHGRRALHLQLHPHHH